MQEAVSRQLGEWGDRHDEEARPRIVRLERDLERVLEDLADDFPLLRALPNVLIATPSRSGGTDARRSIKPTTEGVRRRPILMAIGTRSPSGVLDGVTSR